MTKISITVVNPRGGAPSERPFFRVVCQGCGHDDILFKMLPGERSLYPALLGDAYMRAEQMHRDHLSGDGRGGRRCPVAALLSAGLWGDDEDELPLVRWVRAAKDVCTRAIGLSEMIGEVCPGCEHTNIVHPGAPNPTLKACVICELEAR